MTLQLKSLRSDTTREADGDWIEIPDLPGVALKVRSFNYEPYAVARDLVSRRLAKRYPGEKPVPEIELVGINAKLYVDHILLDWRGFDEPYTRETGLDTLSDIGHRDLRAHLVWAAVQVGKAEIAFLEDAEKN